MQLPRIGLLLGDPSGIGPELTAKLLALRETAESADILVIGDPDIFREGTSIAGTAAAAPRFLEYRDRERGWEMGKATAAGGRYALGSLKLAAETLERGENDAIVFAPLNKQAMKLAGLKQEDELRHMAALLRVETPVSEINVLGGLWTSRVTSHVPLSAVASEISVEKICDAAELIFRALRTAGVAAPRIAVAALNPHAGEGGLTGTEEITLIGPAIEKIRALGIDASGPWPADTLFIAATRGDYDAVVTMYHDQGQIALKLLGFSRGVTVLGGLPFPVATPAHGTAFDIAGKGVADVGPTLEAFRIACRMAVTGRESRRSG
jgi:4-hydroxythreonine-4-phosphate dehydrogenase